MQLVNKKTPPEIDRFSLTVNTSQLGSLAFTLGVLLFTASAHFTCCPVGSMWNAAIFKQRCCQSGLFSATVELFQN